MSKALQGLPSQVRFTLIDEEAEPSPGKEYLANVGKDNAGAGFVTLTVPVASEREANALRDEAVRAATSVTVFVHVSRPRSSMTAPLLFRVHLEPIVVSETSVSIGPIRSRPQWTVAFNAELVAEQGAQ